jgi:cyclophilin family peptidyl-prolyl cis-trans isomerase
VTRGTVEITWVTNHGEITVELDRHGAPCAVHNMTHLVDEGFYDRSRCWRLTDSPRLGVLQCGDIWEAEVGGPGYRFADELTGKETYPRGTIAMGNNGPGTNGSQFFLVRTVADIPPAYTVLGRVVDGMELIDRIGAGGIRPNGAVDGQPTLPVEIRETYSR